MKKFVLFTVGFAVGAIIAFSLILCLHATAQTAGGGAGTAQAPSQDDGQAERLRQYKDLLRSQVDSHKRTEALLDKQAESHKRAEALFDKQDELLKRQEANFERYEKILETWEKQQRQYQKYLDSLPK